MIEQNLAAYIEANASGSASDFKVKRELNIARHALEESLNVHTLATTVLRTAIKNLAEKLTDPSAITSIITLVNHMEERGHRLTQNCKTVAAIAKTGAEIENLLATKMDAVQIYSIITQLPEMLLTLVTSLLFTYFQERNLTIANGRPLELSEVIPEISARIANSFNSQLEESINVLTYAPSSDGGNVNGNGNSGGIIESQVVAMLNTVPTSTSVVEPSTRIARTINELEERT